MRKRVLLVVLFVVFLFLGCSGCIMGNWVSEIGTVLYLDFEGGFYGIVVDGLELDPINLPDEFKRDGLQVNLVGRMMPRFMNVHMWGISFYILRIEKI
jgi:hypothetical protein